MHLTRDELIATIDALRLELSRQITVGHVSGDTHTALEKATSELQEIDAGVAEVMEAM